MNDGIYVEFGCKRKIWVIIFEDEPRVLQMDHRKGDGLVDPERGR